MWNDELLAAFQKAQEALTTNKAITLPRPSDQLWIVTDGALRKYGLGATLYVERNRKPILAGFFSAKLRPNQRQWLPCEIEALSIAAAIKHYSPYLIQSTLPACILTEENFQPALGSLHSCQQQVAFRPPSDTFLVKPFYPPTLPAETLQIATTQPVRSVPS